MIGQKNLIEMIAQQIEDNIFPQFAIFVGEQGCGKKTLMHSLANKHWSFSYICEDVKVDTMRKMIEFAQGSQSKCVFVVPDAQNMSLQAKNSLLKLVEEPPKYATIMMSSTSEEDLLGTIRSRGRIYRFDTYSEAELRQAVTRQDASDCDFIVAVANTIDDVLKLNTVDLAAFRKQIVAILDKADVLSYGNLLKSSQNMAFKDDDEGINLKLYLQGFQVEAVERMKETDDMEELCMYRDIVIETSSKLNDLKIKTVNKQMTYEAWLLNVRKIKEKYGC